MVSKDTKPLSEMSEMVLTTMIGDLSKELNMGEDTIVNDIPSDAGGLTIGLG